MLLTWGLLLGPTLLRRLLLGRLSRSLLLGPTLLGRLLGLLGRLLGLLGRLLPPPRGTLLWRVLRRLLLPLRRPVALRRPVGGLRLRRLLGRLSAPYRHPLRIRIGRRDILGQLLIGPRHLQSVQLDQPCLLETRRNRAWIRGIDAVESNVSVLGAVLRSENLDVAAKLQIVDRPLLGDDIRQFLEEAGSAIPHPGNRDVLAGCRINLPVRILVLSVDDVDVKPGPWLKGSGRLLVASGQSSLTTVTDRTTTGRLTSGNILRWAVPGLPALRTILQSHQAEVPPGHVPERR
jgi:hypothetical protein